MKIYIHVASALARLSATEWRTMQQIIFSGLSYSCSYQAHKLCIPHTLTDTSMLEILIHPRCLRTVYIAILFQFS